MYDFETQIGVIINSTINRLVILQQAQQNIVSQSTTNALAQTIANAKVSAYNDAIIILQNTLEQTYG